MMHVPWHLKELDVIAQGLMVFMPHEAGRMRTNIRVRETGERATVAALASQTQQG
jgi:hypothetical protein